MLHACRHENKAAFIQDISIVFQPELDFTTQGMGVAGDRTDKAQGLAEIMGMSNLCLRPTIPFDAGYPVAVGVEATLQDGIIEVEHVDTFDVVAGLPLFFDTLGGF